MQIDWKKVLLVIGFIAVIIILAYALWWMFFRVEKAPVTPEANVNLVNGRLPNINAGANIPMVNINGVLVPVNGNVNNANANINQPGLIPPPAPIGPSPIALGGRTEVNMAVNRNMDFAAPSGDGVVFYDRDNERLYRLAGPGKEPEIISTQRFPQIMQMAWSGQKDKAVMTFPDGAKIMYDFNNDRQYTLPKQWQDFSFSPQGDKLIFKNIDSTNPDYNWLSFSKPDGSGPTLVEHLGVNAAKVQPAWSPQNNIVAFYHKYVSAEREEIIFLGLNSENYASVTIEGQGFKGMWSPSGQYILFQAYSSGTDYKPNLYVMAGAGTDAVRSQQVNLGVNTWIDKCVFYSDTMIYCAVPKSLPEGSAISPSLANDQSDIFYQIDLTTGIRSQLADPVGTFNAKSPFLSSDKKKLYFRDAFTDRLYNINLP